MTELNTHVFLYFFKAPQQYAAKILEQHEAELEVILWKDGSHKMASGEQGKVCMLTWLATESWGDWKANMITAEVDFKFGPGKVAKGYNILYDSVRDKIKARVEKELTQANVLWRVV